jgi:hypothetical protein
VAAQPRPAPDRLVRPVLLAALKERLAGGMLQANLFEFVSEFRKLSSDQAGLKKYLAEAVKKFHFRLATTPEPLSMSDWVLRLESKSDPIFADLRKAIEKRSPGRPMRDFVVNQLFTQGGLFQPALLVDSNPLERQVVVFWRSQDLGERKRKFEEVRGEIVRAWKMEQALEIARRRASEIADTINEKPSPQRAREALEKAAQSGLGPVFDLWGVAPLVRRGLGYEPYQVPEDRKEQLLYPPPDMVSQLLALDREGQATVLTDQPRRTLYVAVLVSRVVPTMQDFKKMYGDTLERNKLFSIFVQQYLDSYRRRVLLDLRREAGAVDSSGRFDVPDSIRRREFSGPEGS